MAFFRVTFQERNDPAHAWVESYAGSGKAADAIADASADGFVATRVERMPARPACSPLRFRLSQAREAEALRGHPRLLDRQRLQRALVHRWVREDARTPGVVTVYDYSLSTRALEG